MNNWTTIPDDNTIERTIQNLKKHGMEALVVEDGAAAKQKVLDLIPEKARVMNMTSMTLEKIGVVDEVLKSGRYVSIRSELGTLDAAKDHQRKQELGAAPEWVVGSVHAVTEDGMVMTASRTGSQLPAYAYGASRVVWVVGAQKIVKNRDEGFKRIYEHSLLLEQERAKQAYGTSSSVAKILIINEEIKPGRIHLILVKEVLGF